MLLPGHLLSPRLVKGAEAAKTLHLLKAACQQYHQVTVWLVSVAPAHHCLFFATGLFRLWEIRVGDAATLPADNTAIDQLALCRQDTDPTRPGALVYQVLCSQVLTGRYMAIRNGCDGCYLQVCEVQPFVHL